MWLTLRSDLEYFPRILFSSYCSIAVLLLESKWDAYLKQLYKAERHCKLQFNLDLVEWVMDTHFYFILQPLLVLQLYFFSSVGGVWAFFFELVLFADFLMVNFGFHALWISVVFC